MRKNYKLSKTFFLSILFLSSLNVANAQSLRCDDKISAEDIKQVAQSNLKNILNLIDADDLEAYGFKPGDNLTEINIGTPLLKTNLDVQHEGDYKLKIVSAFVPLMLNNEIKCFAVLTNETGVWLPVGIGGSNWAKDIKILAELALNSTHCHIVIQILETGNQYLVNNCSELTSLQKEDGGKPKIVYMTDLMNNK